MAARPSFPTPQTASAPSSFSFQRAKANQRNQGNIIVQYENKRPSPPSRMLPPMDGFTNDRRRGNNNNNSVSSFNGPSMGSPPGQPTFMSSSASAARVGSTGRTRQQRFGNYSNNTSTSSKMSSSSSSKPAKPSLSMEDMTDISKLREAFLKSVDKSKNAPPSSFTNRDMPLASPAQRDSQPTWRLTGARDFRKRIKQKMKEREEEEKRQREQEQRLRRQRQEQQQRRKQPFQGHRQQPHHGMQHEHNSHTPPLPRQRMSPQQMKFKQQQVDKRRSKAKVGGLVMDITGGPPKRAGRLPVRGRIRHNYHKNKKKNDIRSKEVVISPYPLSIAELSPHFRVKKEEVIQILSTLGMRGENTSDDTMLDVDTMELVAMEVGLNPTRSSRRNAVQDQGKDILLQRRGVESEDAVDNRLAPRPPVVCIMGHVDHGKTTLMDSLRKRSLQLTSSSSSLLSSGTNKKTKKKKKKTDKGKKGTDDIAVAGTEAGGITQVISAFQVPLDDNNDDDAAAVTFLDTPGHAAFRAMRESGSNAADVVVLVVAADDGVSPQTVEIINFYKTIVAETGGAGISMVVAMTKIDKPGIDLEESTRRIENQLLEHGIVPETLASTMQSEHGAPVQLVPVSGLTGEGLDDLIEGLALQSEVMDLQADPDARVEGIVMDARVDKGIGVIVDCIVRWGSLQRGDIVVSGTHFGKVKALKEPATGTVLKKVLPSQPVQIVGFRTCPKAGDPLICVECEETAMQLVERRGAAKTFIDSSEFRSDTADEDTDTEVIGVMAQQRIRRSAAEAEAEATMGDDETDNNQDSMDGGNDVIRIPVVVKADADGTLAALRESIVAIGQESEHNIVVDPIVSGIGPLSENEVKSAAQSQAAIFTFNIKQNDREINGLLEELGVQLRSHKVIYSLLDEAKDVFADYLPLSTVEHRHGMAEVQAVFHVNNKNDRETVAGLRVLEGRIHKDKATVGGKNKGGKKDDGDKSELPCLFRVLRGKDVVSTGTLKAASLRKVKEAVLEVRRGEECGLGLDGFDDFEEGDVVECYSVEQKRVFV